MLLQSLELEWIRTDPFEIREVQSRTNYRQALIWWTDSVFLTDVQSRDIVTLVLFKILLIRILSAIMLLLYQDMFSIGDYVNV